MSMRWQPGAMTTFPCLVRSVSSAGVARYRLGHSLVDRYLEFVAGRARPNTLRAVAFDLKTFFTVVTKDRVEVCAVDVFEFLADQRGDRSVVRLADRASGLSARTIARRLSSVSGECASAPHAHGGLHTRLHPCESIRREFDPQPAHLVRHPPSRSEGTSSQLDRRR